MLIFQIFNNDVFKYIHIFTKNFQFLKKIFRNFYIKLSKKNKENIYVAKILLKN